MNKGTILLVEDDDDARELLCRALERAGYECQSAADEQQALARAQERRYFDVLVLDIVLNQNDFAGLDLIAKLRAANVTAPIILITAFADVEKVKIGLNRGAAFLLEKPFRAGELLQAIEKVQSDARHFAHAIERTLRRAELTEKEFSVAKHLLDGLSSTEIAEFEANSAKTIRQHVSRIYEKLGVNSRADFFRLMYSGSAGANSE